MKTLALALAITVSVSTAGADDLAKTRETLRAGKGGADFAGSLSAAVDDASTTGDSISLLSEFSRMVDDPERRREFILRLAAFHELESSYVLAAERYEEAALLVPGKRDDAALLRAAVCWIATGDGERASALVRGLQDAGHPRPVSDGAALVTAWSAWLRGERTAALDGASKLMGGTARYGALLLAAAATEGSVRDGYFSSLEKEYGRSRDAGLPPYALIGSFKPGFEVADGHVPPPSGPSTPAPSPASAPSAVPPTAGKTLPPPQGQYWLQVGAFREESRADALAGRLKAGGFGAVIASKRNAEGDLFAVLVPSGKDGERTLLGLKDAGFEAYPVF